MRHPRLLSMLVALTALLVLSPLRAGASPDSQKGLRPFRFITFSTDPATLVAQARGYFAAEGLAVEITKTPDSTFQVTTHLPRQTHTPSGIPTPCEGARLLTTAESSRAVPS